MDIATVTDADGFTVSSNYETEADLRATLTPDVEPEPAAVAEPETPVAPKVDKRTREGRKQSVQQEIDALWAQKKTAERETLAETDRLATVRRELADLEAKRPAPAAVVETPAAAPVTASDYQRYMAMPAAPKNDGSFTNYDDYTAALAVFIADQRFEERTAAARIASSASMQARTFHERLTAAEKSDPDWQTHVDPIFLQTKPVSQLRPGERGDYRNGIAEVIVTSEHPVALMRYLTEHKHDPDIQRLSTLPPDQFFRQMGSLEARVTAAPPVPAAPRPVISQAKPLIKTVSGSAHVPSADDGPPGDDATDAQIDAHWAKVRAGGYRS